MIMKWRKKPLVIEALEWTGDNAQEMRKFGFEGYLAGLEKGVYLVRELDGSLIIYTAEKFYATYERDLIWE